MTELDTIFRKGNKRDEVIFDLKKLVESQMKQIMQLSKDNDTLRICWPDNSPQPNLSGASG